MPEIHVFPNIDRQAPPPPAGAVLHSTEDWTLIGLPKGMRSGKASVMISAPIRVNGAAVTAVVETSLQVFLNAATILATEYRDQVDRPGFAKVSPAVRGLIKSRIFDRILPALGNDMTVADHVAELVMRSLEDDTGQEVAP